MKQPSQILPVLLATKWQYFKSLSSLILQVQWGYVAMIYDRVILHTARARSYYVAINHDQVIPNSARAHIKCVAKFRVPFIRYTARDPSN
jgi:hypothetical protein